MKYNLLALFFCSFAFYISECYGQYNQQQYLQAFRTPFASGQMQQPQPQPPYAYNTGQYPTQPPLNPASSPYGTQQPYSNPMVDNGQSPTTNQNPSTPKMPFGCDLTARQQLANCAQHLVSLGLFGTSTSQLERMTFHDFKQQSVDYIVQTCNAYKSYNDCLEGSAVKRVCYTLQPFNQRYAIADAGLAYICQEAQDVIVPNWKCLIRTLSQEDVLDCESHIAKDAANWQTTTDISAQRNQSMCSSLRDYAECIDDPIERSCGRPTRDSTIQMMERQARVVMPMCTLGVGSIVPSIVFLVVPVLAAFVY